MIIVILQSERHRMTVTTRDRWLGVVVLLALALHAWSMQRADLTLAHMLWSCHVASLMLAIGLIAQSRLAVTAGLLFHLAIGLPAWLVEVVVTRGTFGGAELVGHLLATSVVLNLLTIAAGMLFLGFK